MGIIHPKEIPQAPGSRAEIRRAASIFTRNALGASKMLGEEVQFIRGRLVGKLVEPFLGGGGGGLKMREGEKKWQLAVRRTANWLSAFLWKV